jgi:hypothetical protein
MSEEEVFVENENILNILIEEQNNNDAECVNDFILQEDITKIEDVYQNDNNNEEKNIEIDANLVNDNQVNAISRTYGFIISRHVNSERTNKYWNRCVKLIRTFYPYRLIVIIDDNSNPNFLKADHDYKNLIVIQGEYPGRGELLPYIYYARNKWFDRAVIIHDSVFFHKRMPFEGLDLPVISLWHFNKANNKTDFDPGIASALNHSDAIIRCLNNRNWVGCFGVQSFIKHSFLVHIMNKYNIENLINVVTNRTNRCCLERIFAIIFFLELRKVNTSLFGDIQRGGKFGHTYDEYIKKLKNTNTVNADVVKVFTGR